MTWPNSCLWLWWENTATRWFSVDGTHKTCPSSHPPLTALLHSGHTTPNVNTHIHTHTLTCAHTHTPKTTLLLLHYSLCHTLSTYWKHTLPFLFLLTHTHTLEVNEPFPSVCRKPNGYKPVTHQKHTCCMFSFVFFTFPHTDCRDLERGKTAASFTVLASFDPRGVGLHLHSLHTHTHHSVAACHFQRSCWGSTGQSALFMMVPSFSFQFP